MMNIRTIPTMTVADCLRDEGTPGYRYIAKLAAPEIRKIKATRASTIRWEVTTAILNAAADLGIEIDPPRRTAAFIARVCSR